MSETCAMTQCQMTKECKRRECVFHIRDEFNFETPKNPQEDFTDKQNKKLIEKGIFSTHYPKFYTYTGPGAIYVRCKDVIL